MNVHGDDLFQQQEGLFAGLSRQEYDSGQNIGHLHGSKVVFFAILAGKQHGKVQGLGQQQGKMMTGINSHGCQHRVNFPGKIVLQIQCLLPGEAFRTRHAHTTSCQGRQEVLVHNLVLPLHLGANASC